jgi:hypothetical protein
VLVLARPGWFAIAARAAAATGKGIGRGCQQSQEQGQAEGARWFHASSIAQSLESVAGLSRGLACLGWESFHPVEGSCLGQPGICVS